MGLALSGSGKTLISANVGDDAPSLTVLERGRTWEVRHLLAAPPNRPQVQPADDAWHSVSFGLAFSGEHAIYLTEGASGRVGLIDLASGERRRAIDLNQNGYRDSFTGELVVDAVRNVLYVADQANLRIAVIDTRSRQVLASVKVAGLPLLLVLSPDRRKLYAALSDIGVDAIDITEPAAPKSEALIPIGAPGGMVAAGERLYVTNSVDDTVAVIDCRENRVEAEIPIRIPNLTAFRGVLPMGIAYDDKTGWLLVAESGMNAIGVVDTQSRQVIGHIPAGWFPTRVLVANGMVYVANLYGRGGSIREMEPGSISIYSLPAATALPGYTDFVMRAGGFLGSAASPPPVPHEIKYVVLIVKSGQTFDEVLGDLTSTASGPVMAAPQLARFGSQGYANGRGKRLSLQRVNITPNLHAIAGRWSFSDNFYADSRWSAAGHEWLSGSYPDAWMQAGLRTAPGQKDRAEDGPIWRDLAKHQIPFYGLGRPGDTEWDAKTSDTDRASRFIREIDGRFAGPGGDLPRFLYVYLPNDSLSEPRPEGGYPYAESFAADNDLAVGRILAYLSASKWWKQMAVFITEDAARGLDHVDAHRTLLLCAGPWAKRGYVSHRNGSFPALVRTILEILQLPPLNLNDATSASLSDCFTSQPDFRPYQAVPSNPALFDPAR